MIFEVLVWGLAIGIIHFVLIGALYGNPMVDRLYNDAQAQEPGVRKWPNKGKYLITQFLGTQIEIFILTAGYFWLRDLLGIESWNGAFLLGALFSGIRVYPRFWNMWIQSTYPKHLLRIEFINGIISTYIVVLGLEMLT